MNTTTTSTVERFCVSCSAPVHVPATSDDAWGDTVRCDRCQAPNRLAVGARVYAGRWNMSGAAFHVTPGTVVGESPAGWLVHDDGAPADWVQPFAADSLELIADRPVSR